MTYTKEFIQDKLIMDNRWLERGITAIYQFQTDREKRVQDTIEDNGVGFSGADGNFLSSLAQWISNSHAPEGQRLTMKQAAVARKKMRKYAGQLLRIIQNKQ